MTIVHNENTDQVSTRNIRIRLGLFALICVAFVTGIRLAELKSKNNSNFPVERGNIRVYDLISRDRAENEVTIYQVESYEENGTITNRYTLDYWLDPQRPGQVGFVFVFAEPLNLSDYSYMQLKCFLAAPSLWIRVASDLKDLDAIEIKKGSYGLTARADEQEISIPFSAFAKTDWKNILVLNFIVDADTTVKIASKRFAIEKIEFIK